MEFFFDVLKGMFLGVIFVTLCALVLGLPLMILWNWLMPMLFGLTKITFWQAIGLNILAGILFGHSSASVSND